MGAALTWIGRALAQGLAGLGILDLFGFGHSDDDDNLWAIVLGTVAVILGGWVYLLKTGRLRK